MGGEGGGGAYLSGVTESDTKVVADSVVYILRAVQLAGGGATHHDVEFADLGAVEHGVKSGNLVNANCGHLHDLQSIILD